MLDMDPEDGGYATTDEELDSGNEDFDLEQDLQLWLNQLDSSASTLKCSSTKRKRTSDHPAKNNQQLESDAKQDIDFDSILGELNCLDEQFSEQLNFSTPSSSQSIPTNCKNASKAAASGGKTRQNNQSTASDGFGEIGSQLQFALSELSQIGNTVDIDNYGINNYNKETLDPVKPKTSSAAAEGGGGGKQHYGTVRSSERSHYHQPERSFMEDGKSFRIGDTLERNAASVHTGNRQLRNNGGGGGGGKDSISLASYDSQSSTNSLNRSNKDFRTSQQSVTAENSAQVCLKVFSSDGSSKSVMVDGSTTVGHLCDMLVEKNHVDGNKLWSVNEQIPELFMQRQLEDHRCVLGEIQGWTAQSTNRLVFLETPKKYDMFDNATIIDETYWEPETLDGWLHLKSDGKKTWKKWNFVVKTGGIYYNPKGKGKSDMTCLTALQDVEIYTGVAWKKKFKAPTEFGIALKPISMQKKGPESVKYLCADDHAVMWKWVSALRLAKHGYQLYRDYCRSAKAFESISLSSSGVSFSSSNVSSSSSSRNLADGDRQSVIVKPNGHHQRLSEILDESTVPMELVYDCPVNTLRRGSGEAARGNSDHAGSSKIKAQLPITASTARLLSMQQPGIVKAVPQTMNRGESFKQPLPQQQQQWQQQLPSTSHHQQQQQWQQPQQPNVRPAFVTEREPVRPSSSFENSDIYRSPTPDLPPPPPELLTPCTDDPVTPPSSSLSPSIRKPGPPAPPRRDQSTKLSIRRKTENVQTKNFIMNLQRAIGQKQTHGSEGLTRLEMPLPPPPVYSEDPSYLDLGELPPPPAELLEELKIMRRKSRPPPITLPKQSTLLRSSK